MGYMRERDSQSVTGQSVYERVGFADPQLTRLQHNVKVVIEELGHQLISVRPGVINPVVYHSCLVAFG